MHDPEHMVGKRPTRRSGPAARPQKSPWGKLSRITPHKRPSDRPRRSRRTCGALFGPCGAPIRGASGVDVMAQFARRPFAGEWAQGAAGRKTFL
jgi:hypothetical protein